MLGVEARARRTCLAPGRAARRIEDAVPGALAGRVAPAGGADVGCPAARHSIARQLHPCSVGHPGALAIPLGTRRRCDRTHFLVPAPSSARRVPPSLTRCVARAASTVSRRSLDLRIFVEPERHLRRESAWALDEVGLLHHRSIASFFDFGSGRCLEARGCACSRTRGTRSSSMCCSRERAIGRVPVDVALFDVDVCCSRKLLAFRHVVQVGLQVEDWLGHGRHCKADFNSAVSGHRRRITLKTEPRC